MNVAALAPVLQFLFTSRADELALATRFIQRQRAFSGGDFLRALVLGWLKRPRASLEDLALPLNISRQALHQRWTNQAATFCRHVLQEAVTCLLQARPQTLPLLERFQGVYLDDTTQLWLPDACVDTFPGCGSGPPGPGQARMKVLTRWEIQGGRLCHLGIHAGRAADAVTQRLAPPLPAGALHLADLGFIDFARLQVLSEQGVYWVTKLPVQSRLYRDGHAVLPLWEQLRAWRQAGPQPWDLSARVGNKSVLHGRLIALACPPEVVASRLRKLEAAARRRGRSVSVRQRELCHWTVLFTNVPLSWLNSEQVGLIYRLRWQIELLFKRFKSEGGLGQSRSHHRYRVESEWYLKLLGQVVRNWLLLLRGGPLLNVNKVQLGRVISDRLAAVFAALRQREDLEAVLRELEEKLACVRRRTHRRTHKAMYERLEGEEQNN